MNVMPTLGFPGEPGAEDILGEALVVGAAADSADIDDCRRGMD